LQAQTEEKISTELISSRCAVKSTPCLIHAMFRTLDMLKARLGIMSRAVTNNLSTKD